MAKHKALKDAIREKAIRQKLEQTLKEHYQRGLLTGSRAILKVVADEAVKADATPEERLAAILKFCNTSLALTAKTDVGSTDAKERLNEALGEPEGGEADTEKSEAGKIVELPQPTVAVAEDTAK